MFTSARLKLTGWYLLIIMIVSGLFSIVVYRSLTLEISRGMRQQALRSLSHGPIEIIPPEVFRDLDDEIFIEARNRVAIDLAALNSGILIISGILAYFLAGKTLKPIEEMVEEQKRFVADASHELRTPLTAMKTEIEVALRSKQLSSKEVGILLGSNLEEVNKMQSLSNYLLTLNHYRDSGNDFPRTKVILMDVIEKAIASVKPLADKKLINISVSGENSNITGNSVALIELMTLLLDNGIKYSHKNGKINITTSKDSKTATLSIQDFGIGIKSSDIPYIFNRFYRADPSRNKNHEDGYGLGLSIAKNIVNLHKGHISVTSAPGEGSVFTIKLPLSNLS